MNIPAADLLYVTSFVEVAWGLALIGITMIMHGFGMLGAVQLAEWLAGRLERFHKILSGVVILVLASWFIVIVHLVETLVWAAFFVWKDAMPNFSLSYYFALLEYASIGSDYNLPLRWRLLEGMTTIAGLLSFAWSTGVLYSITEVLQQRQSAKPAP